MIRKRITAAALAASLVSAPSAGRADWQNPQGVCVDSRGCDGNAVDSSPSNSGGVSIPWGHVTSNRLELVKECGNKPLCILIRFPVALMVGVVFDGPYYIGKGVGYGLYYGGVGLGKGLYYGGRGIGKGVVATGAAIGRGLAYPFNRPPKPVLPPTTWEQYKHDVLKHQKKLAKADKKNKENYKWCVKNVPLEFSANRARWEERCNGDDAVSRASLPAAVLADANKIFFTGSSPHEGPVTAHESAKNAASAVPAQSEVEGIAPPPAPLTIEPTTESKSRMDAPVAQEANAPGTPGDSIAQQAVETGISVEKAGMTKAAPAAGSPSGISSPGGGEAQGEAKGTPPGSAPAVPIGRGTSEQIGLMLSQGGLPASAGGPAYLRHDGTATAAPTASVPAAPAPAAKAAAGPLAATIPLIHDSPTLSGIYVELVKQRYTFVFGSAGGGTYAVKGRSGRIVVDPDQAKTPAVLAGLLAHEFGHTRYANKDIRMSDYTKKDDYVSAVVKDRLADEGEATLTAIQGARELSAKSVAISIPGVKTAEYEKIFDKYPKAEERQVARDEIGAIFGADEHPSTSTGETYSEYYSKDPSAEWDAAHTTSKTSP